MPLRLDSVITMSTEEMTRQQWKNMFRSLTFIDKDDKEIQAFDHRVDAGVVIMPRGALNLLPKTLDVSDLRSRPTLPKLEYVKELDAPGYSGQKAAVKAMFEFEQGRVIAPPGKGKTEIGLAFAAACRTRTLVVVHTRDLFKQWATRAESSVPGASIGTIQGSTCEIGHITIAMAQTLKRYLPSGGEFWRQFGCVIVDEAHHAAAETWEWLLNACTAYYRLGLTASEKRSDGRQALVKFNIGPVIYRMPFESQVPMTVVPVFTEFTSSYNATRWARLVRDLVENEARNKMIAEVIEREIKAGRSVLVLSRQIKHLELIAEALSSDVDGQFRIVTGHLRGAVREEEIDALRDGSLSCILGTQLFEEGVDIQRLNCLVLAFPGTDITTLQKVGRGARKFEGKTDTLVYDFVDHRVAVLTRQWLQRRQWYKEQPDIKVATQKAKEDGDDNKKKGSKTWADLRKSAIKVARSRRAA